MNKVLIVDDDPDCLDILNLLIGEGGFKTYAFPQPPSIDEIAQIKPDLVLLDEWLHGAKGSDLCKRIKTDNNLKLTPVVLLSAVNNLAEIATESCADAYLVKPFGLGDVEDIIKQFLINPKC